MANVSLSKLGKKFGSVEVLHGLDLEIADGEFAVFVGPSGCGKSTLLRMIAGLEDVTTGTLSIAGKVVYDVEAADRGVAMVFQNYALYPHMTVEQNMRFGLEIARAEQTIAAERIAHTARMLQMDHLLQRKPSALSGGQRQRVAIGRAIVRDPGIFLFDEPLSNLDASLRVQTRIELAKLHRLLGTTMIYVTHDQVEAMTLADKIVVMNAGRIAQCGTPMEVYDHPADRFVASFIGTSRINFFELDPDRSQARLSRTGNLIPVPERLKESEISSIGIRPEHLAVTRGGEGTIEIISGAVSVIERLGDHTLVYIENEAGEAVCVKLLGNPKVAISDRLTLYAMPESIHFFDGAGKSC